MKFTLSWLKKFLDTEANIFQIGEKLNEIGFEVEEIIDHSKSLKDFIVAKIESTKKHPSADNLQLCKVNNGKEILDIVCGAKNARAGIKVVLAPVGSLIPNGNFKIKASSIRGEPSNGMLCSEEELLIGKDSQGIIELLNEAVVGEPFINYHKNLNDPIIEISVTPNRGDCLGIYGIARELAAAGIGKLKNIETNKNHKEFTSDLNLHVDLECSKLFLLKEFRNLKNKQSPLWLQNLLFSIGKQPISFFVDITNYICYSFARPMHVYDADKIGRNIALRKALNNEEFKSLDGNSYFLSEEDIAVVSDNKVISLAGIMGGIDSMVTDETQNIILEIALFDNIQIAKTGRRLKIESDARYRFERHVDFNFVGTAEKIFTSLLTEEYSENEFLISKNILSGDLASPEKIIYFDISTIKKITGLELNLETISDILTKLGFLILGNKNNILEIKIPSWRGDIEIAEDIVEEIVRIYGLDKIEISHIPDLKIVRIFNQLQQRIYTSRRMMASFGYDEVITWSFMDEKKLSNYVTINNNLKLSNPISQELNYMRPSVIFNLIDVIRNNQARSLCNLSIFEIGPVFKEASVNREEQILTAVRSGEIISKNPHQNHREVDIYDIKADLERILGYFSFSFEKLTLDFSDVPNYYHPKRSAKLSLGKNHLGYFGELHPRIKEGLNFNLVAFELNLSNLPETKLKFGKSSDYNPSDYQMVTRDFAFLLSKDYLAGEIVKAVKGIDKNLIKDVVIFDLYEGSKLNLGEKSLAFKVLIQANDRTLTDLEINSLSEKIINLLEKNFLAKLRDK